MTLVLSHLLLGCVLLAQAGPACLCSLEHLLFCGRADARTAAPAARDIDHRPCGDAGCSAPAPCPRHSVHSCSTQKNIEPGPRQMPAIDLPAPDPRGSGTAGVLECPRGRTLDADAPDLPVDGARSLPLLI